MNLKSIKSFAAIAKHTIVKYSPEILMGLGAASFVATVVAASKETIKEQEILEAHQEVLEDFEVMHEVHELDDKAYKKSRINEYKDLTVLTVKNYIPAVAFGTVSLACFFGTFGIMKKRYTTLALAYTALEESFRAYRQRVIADKGEEADLYYLTGSKVKEVTVKDEEGNKTKQKQMLLPDGSLASPYVFKFGKYKENGELNQQWCNDQTLNRSYIYGQLDYINNQLMYNRTVFDDNHNVKVRGWVFLNELRELMGEDGNTAGSVVGNMIGNGEPGCNGFINPKRIYEATEIDPEDGSEIPCFIIDPNVDGLIYDIIGKPEKVPFKLTYDVYGEDIYV